MIRLRNFRLCERVQAHCHFLRLRAVVDKHERRTRIANVTQHQWCYRWPHTDAHVSQVRNWRLDRNFHLLVHSAIDDRYRTKIAVTFFSGATSTKKSRNLIEWTLRRRQPNS